MSEYRYDNGLNEYKLSPEELQKLWERTGPPGTINGQPGKKVRRPVTTDQPVSSEKQRERAIKSHAGRPKSKGPDQDYVLREIAIGKTIADVERQLGMKKNTLYYWIKHWDLIGITPGKARQLLGKEEKEDEDMSTTTEELTRERYLDLRLKEHGRTAIMKKHFGNTVKFYRQLSEWGIKEADAENRELDLLAAERKAKEAGEPEEKPRQPAPQESQQPPQPSTYESLTRAKGEVDRLEVEVERLREQLTKTIGERNQYQQALSELKESFADKDEAIEYWKTEHRKVSDKLSHAGKALGNSTSLDHYQKLASRTAETDWDQVALNLVRDPRKLKLLNFATGAAGEAGELANEVKKVIFHGHAYDPDAIAKEIGDTLWYLSQLALACGYSFETVAKWNIEKLQERYPEGFSKQASVERRDLAEEAEGSAHG